MPSSRSILALSAAALVSTAAHADFVVSSGATVNVSCAGGSCEATTAKAVLNVSTLMSMLGSGDVELHTGKSHDIDIDAQIFWSSGSKLTLSARDSIRINQSISVTGTGGVAMYYDEPRGATITYADGASISFWDTSSQLTINGHAYKLVNDIAGLAANANIRVALAKSYDAAADGVYAHAPIFQQNGTIDGLGNTISNFSLNDPTEGASVGLVGYSGGPIVHLRLANVNVTGGTYAFVGGLVAWAGDVLYNDSVSGQVTTGVGTPSREAAAGGLAGLDTPTKTSGLSADVAVHGGTGAWVGGLVGHGGATSSHASGTVTSDGGAGSRAGGLIGNGAAFTSYATGDVSGAQYDGGLIGYASLASQADASGSVSGPDGASVGGLVGYLNGSISSVFAMGTATGGDGSMVGGLVGQSNGFVTDAYARGAVTATGTSSAGGLIGLNLRQVTYSYSTGTVTSAAMHQRGGLIGVDNSSEGAHIYTYWDMTTSHIKNPTRGAGNIANDPNIIGLTQVQLRSALPNGFSTLGWGQKAKFNGRLPYLLDWPPH